MTVCEQQEKREEDREQSYIADLRRRVQHPTLHAGRSVRTPIKELHTQSLGVDPHT